MSKTDKKTKFSMQHWHYVALFLILYDVITTAASYFLAIYIRFDLRMTPMMESFGQALIRFLPLYVIGTLLIYFAFHLYHSIWQFASFIEMKRIIAAMGCCILLSIGVSMISGPLPVSAYIAGIIFQFFFCCTIRFSYRFILMMRRIQARSSKPLRNTMIIGAGQAGQMLEYDARRSSESDFNICCFIDDNVNKHHRSIDQIPVVGGRDCILKAAEEYNIQVILFAIPSAKLEEKRDILHICQETGCEVRVLPSYISLTKKNIQIQSLQNIKMEDLLGRDPVHVDTAEILESIADKVILITGGGGSIGSELSRQIASHHPKMLIILDVYENNAYEIQQELKRKYPDLNLKVLISSVRDSVRINHIFKTYRPQIVFHAAAHKHVPLMEDAPAEAIKNNVFGTYKTARAALEYGAERFILISTDKAVNPTNIMGASKRMCEMIIQAMDAQSQKHQSNCIPAIGGNHHSGEQPMKNLKTQFAAVRFGNVLGSNGSVIPLFKKQIEEGGPVTVTHPDIIRYFMTIQEAVSLVLEAGTYARGGEIFVLNMGEPVKIADLATNLIRMAGKTPGKDINIVYTGLRPGEKLYEEKLMEEEGLEKTKNSLIHIGKPIEFDREQFLKDLPKLYRIAMTNQEEELINTVEEMVSTYSPDWNYFNQNGWFEKTVRAFNKTAGNVIAAH